MLPWIASCRAQAHTHHRYFRHLQVWTAAPQPPNLPVSGYSSMGRDSYEHEHRRDNPTRDRRDNQDRRTRKRTRAEGDGEDDYRANGRGSSRGDREERHTKVRKLVQQLAAEFLDKLCLGSPSCESIGVGLCIGLLAEEELPVMCSAWQIFMVFLRSSDARQCADAVFRCLVASQKSEQWSDKSVTLRRRGKRPRREGHAVHPVCVRY